MLAVVISSVTTVLTYCFILLIAGWCWFQWRYRHLIHVASDLPSTSYKRFPIIGHAHLTLFGIEKMTEHVMAMTLDAVNRGLKSTCFWCGPLPLVVVFDQDDIKKVLTSSITAEKGDEMDYVKWALGDGLLTAPANIWKITRRHINPLFHPRNMDCLIPMFNRNSRELVSNLSKHVGRGPMDIMEPATSNGLKSVCQLIFGQDMEFDVNSPEFRGLFTVIESLHVIFIKRILQPWLRIDSIFHFFYRDEIKVGNYLWNRFTEIPLKKSKAGYLLKYIKENSPEENHFSEDVALQSEEALNLVDVYSVLQKKYPQFTDKELEAEMVTLYNAGTEPSTVALCTCLLLLAKYPSIQDRLYEEISSVVGPDDDVTMQDLRNMVYLDQVFKETLRWATIVPFIIRKTSADLKLSSYTVPANTTIIVSLAGSSKDPKNFPDPLRFDPERFSTENTAGKERYSFLPFSGGPRNCIGKNYTNLLVKVGIVHVLRRYRLSTEVDIHNMRRRLIIVLTSAEGYHLSLENRH